VSWVFSSIPTVDWSPYALFSYDNTRLVIALDTSPTRLALARHNATLYGVADRIEFVLADFVSFARSHLAHSALPSSSVNARRPRAIDVVFLSPPWGGVDYIAGDAQMDDPSARALADGEEEVQHPEYALASVRPLGGVALFALARAITPNVAYFLPRNTRLGEIAGLLDVAPETRDGPVGKAQAEGGSGGGPEVDGIREDGGKDGRTEIVEIEEEWMGTKLKALTCYFGGLAAGQEGMFEL
jgi:trimethylguanosine synthase